MLQVVLDGVQTISAQNYEWDFVIWYIILGVGIAVISTGIATILVYFLTKAARNREKNKDEEQAKEIVFRLAAKMILISQTEYYSKEGWIPMHTKTIMLNLCEAMKDFGNGDVKQCRETIEKLRTYQLNSKK